MKVIIGCEYSQIVTKAFRDKGHEAYSCDTLPTDGDPEWHFQGDIFTVLAKEKFDLGIFHPPCTYLANSGVSWLYRQDGRWEKMRSGAHFFKRLMETDIPLKAIENPIMHKYAKEIIGKNYTQIVQPYMFGHLEQKATCLWLDGLEPLTETDNVYTEMMKLPKRERERLHYLPPSKDRWKIRSKTFLGIGKAMADQWG